ncbi:NUDIX domain-containing protein [Agaribacterium haliotis]|uniref:NUDIX domain-containing protein n=1 Tax=Agaribacterium haliotis TaxID=2013869 RepID=UPI000BB57DCA|nr:NUDIX hydrolase [Agaribacterium haliotis]
MQQTLTSERPHLTVAAVVEQNDKFLLVRELCNGELKLNQPAGHVENGESLIQAVERECLEETGWQVTASSFLGISQFSAPNGITYLRCSFVCKAIKQLEHYTLDSDIHEALWLSREQIFSQQHSHRSAMVANDIKRYEQGLQFQIEQLYCLLAQFDA